jgi:hopene-associated glycosyltransferase HpnB
MAATLAWCTLLAWFALATLHGQFWRVLLPARAPDPPAWPDVVAVAPARDEAGVIVAALRSLLAQDYAGRFHVIVVDDHSVDRTASVARDTAAALAASARLSVIAARPLPGGWAGKVWAQSEGLRVQRERFPQAGYVWLTDADIEHPATALRDLVARAECGRLVLTSEMVRLRCDSFAERACMPAFVFFFALLYPFARVNDPGSRVAAAAGGSMLVRTDALDAIGGIAAIKDALIDDCALAARLKRHGPIRLDLARGSRSLRAYDDWRSIRDMIARSAYTQLRHSPLLLAATLLGMLLLFAAPVLLAPAHGAALAAWLLMMGLYLPMLRYHGRPAWWAPLLPLVAMFYLGATLASAWRYQRGRGGQWKGRSQAAQSR